MKSKMKIAIGCILFLLFLSGIRLVWLAGEHAVESPVVKNGVLDLRGWELPEDAAIPLDGQWEFYPSRLIGPGDISNGNFRPASGSDYIAVPGDWNSRYSDADAQPSIRYGTYHLRILADEDAVPQLKLRVQEIRNASAVYVNGKFVAGMGTPGDRADLYEPRVLPYDVPLPSGDRIDIVIHAANHAGAGGITKSIHFGSAEAVDRRTSISANMQLLMSVVLLVHVVYAVLLFLLGAGNRGLLYFGMVVFSAILSVLTVDDRLLFEWFPMPYEITVKLALLSYIAVIAFIPPTFKHMFPGCGNERLLKIHSVFYILYTAFLLLSPLPLAYAATPLLMAFFYWFSIFIAVSILFFAIRKQEDVFYLLLAVAAIVSSLIWTRVLSNTMTYQPIYYPFDLMFAVFAFAAFWFKRFFRTVDQTIRLSKQLQLVDQRKDEFLTNTSHELRNPLHGIMNISQSMLDDPVSPPTKANRERLELQIAVAWRMSRMLDDLLDVARLKENIVQLELSSLRLQLVVDGVLGMLRYMLDGKPIELRTDIADEFPAVRADENRLIQIMFNLVHNAIKYTERGSISIRADVRNGVARIRVADTGIGMDEATLGKIFIPYEQGESARRGPNGGFGLGLSICKQLVELHGGALNVSSAPGQGSTFEFTLPLAGAGEPEAPGPAAVPALASDIEAAAAVGADAEPLVPLAETNKPKVLAVDDDNINLKILKDILSTESYSVTVVENAEAALDELEKNRYDLVVSDVMMPHMSGYELARVIRERFSVSELPILLLTAKSRLEDIAAGFRAGANDYVTKPVDSWELRYRVRALIGMKLSMEERLRMEGAWLQSQIQPHFVHNALNSIAALGTVDPGRAQALLEQFSNYLRMSYSFHNSDHVVPIDKELALVRSYLYIEKERFGERLNVHWKIDGGLRFSVPPMSVQTIVENAVRHGIMKRAAGGSITIEIGKEEEFVMIRVSDNGVGMSADRAERILAGQDGGIGLRNTDRRLKQLFGTGLELRSAPNEGTTVWFRIPKPKA